MYSPRGFFERSMNAFKSLVSQHGIFLSVLLGASALYCFIISRVSLEGDASHYAFRALSWLDWFTGQEGAMKLVGHEEWWMGLSFQDHPPAVFFIQHYFFKVFGETSFVALLPSAVAGLLTLGVVYSVVLRLSNKETALWAAFFLAVDSLAIRMFTNGYHEGVTAFFSIASFALLLLYLETEKRIYVLTGAIVLGASLLSKYTAIFGAAGFFTVLLTGARAHFSLLRVRNESWNVLASLALCAVVLAPALVYNIMLFRSAHVFDTALAMALGTENVFHGRASLNVFGNLFDLFSSLLSIDNSVFIAVSLCAIVWLCVKCVREEGSILERGLLVYTLFLFLMFACMGASNRYLPVFAPFLSMASAIGIVEFRKRAPKNLSRPGIFLFVALLLAYSLNTHVHPRPLGWVGVTYSEERGRDFGLNNLETYLRSIIGPLSEPQKPKSIPDIYRIGLPVDAPANAKEILIFDDRFNFFSLWWYLERYTLLHGVALYPGSAGISQRLLGGPAFNRTVLPSEDTPVYYIEVVSKEFMNPHQIGNPWPEYLSRLFEENRLKFETIYDLGGEPVFRVYELNP